MTFAEVRKLRFYHLSQEVDRGCGEQISIQREDFDLAKEYAKLRVKIGNEVGAIVTFTGTVGAGFQKILKNERLLYVWNIIPV